MARRRNKKNKSQQRSTPSNPAQWFIDWIRGDVDNQSGVDVNREAALTYPALIRGVSLISTDIAKLPLVIYERTDKGKKEATSHPLYFILKFEPNAIMSSLTFRQTVQVDALLHGNGFAYILRGADNVEEILPLSAQNTWPETKRGPFRYITWVDGHEYDIQPEDMIHIRWISPDGVNAYSLLNKAKETLGLGIGARRYGARFFKNNARPTTILEHPNQLSPDAAKRLREGWQKAYGGENQNGTAVLEEGMKANAVGVNNNDAQFIETRQHEIREIATLLGLPPHKLGDTTRTAYASLEQENQSYLDECLDGWLCTWEQELERRLLTKEERISGKYFIRFTRQALVRANMEARYKAYQTAVGKPFMLPNEARDLEDFDPIDGGDTLANPLNMLNPGGDPDATAKKKDDTQDSDVDKMRNANHALVVESCRRIIHRLADDTRAAAKKPEKFNDYLDSMQSRHLKPMIDILTPVVLSLRLAGPTMIEADDAAIEYLKEYHAGLLSYAGKCKRSDIIARINYYTEELERTGPESLAHRLELEKEPCEKTE
jgi:HK97 family phage portal protein